jgi:hypothetical protein
MLEDAGTSMQDGSVPDAGAQNETMTCDKSESYRSGEATVTVRWAEFEIDPGATEVTVCHVGSSTLPPDNGRDTCGRSTAHYQWFRGTTTGFVRCGHSVNHDDPDTPDTDSPDPISITVHR